MKRKINRLTAKAVEHAERDKCDGYGLWLQYSPIYKTKSWLFRFMIDGKADSMGLGPVATVSLAKARAKAELARDLVREGINPREASDAERRQRKVDAAKAITFKQCADKYIEATRAGWKNAKHARQWFGVFNETRRGSLRFPAATAAINDLPVEAIDTGLVLKVLEPLWTKTPETAGRVRGRIEAVLDWAKVREYRDGENPARWKAHLDKILPRRARLTRGHHKAVPYVEMPGFMADLRPRGGMAARALEVAILTSVRTGEALGARWDEIDLDARSWTIPAARMKGGREHRVPLSDRVVDILMGLPREGAFVFPGARGGSLASSALLNLVRAMLGPGATVHGFRSTFRDWAAETTAFPNEMLELALAHAVSDKVEAAYRRGDMMEKRRRLMEAWAHYCKAPAKRGNNFTPIRERAS
jgi:integrase